MARLTSFFVLATMMLAASALSVHMPEVRASSKPLVVVVSASARIKDISTATLRRIFQGMPTEFEGGKRFIPVNQAPGTPLRIQFDQAVLGLAPSQVGAFWIDRRIRDQSPPPRTVPSVDLALRVVASLPGAIAYVAQDGLNASVKSLTVDGRSVDRPDYLLR